MNRKGFELSFGWLFAIIVGAVIIFLAIYAAGKLASNQNQIINTETGKELGILLSPVETNLESGELSFITFPRDTKVGNMCSDLGNFGSQKINITSDTGISGGNDVGVASSFYNKYIFSSTIIDGKTLYVFAKPVEIAYKIADLILIWSDKESYCFVMPPREIEDELSAMKPKNIYVAEVASKISNCSKSSKKVCFTANTNTKCDIQVSMNSKAVTKGNSTVYFEGTALLYGAIFASPSTYECQVKRLMKRNSELALLYAGKANNLGSRGCNSNLQETFLAYANHSLRVNSSRQLKDIQIEAADIARRNDELLCQMF
jgi:hypothetical protein